MLRLCWRATFLYLKGRFCLAQFLDESWESAWRPFVASDFKSPTFFWLIHVNMGVVLVLSLLLVFLPTQPSTPLSAEEVVLLLTVAVVSVPLTSSG